MRSPPGHMDAIQRIPRHLKATPKNGLMFPKDDRLRVEAFT